MIVFDLRCRDAGHVFEAWFGSSTDYTEQQERGLVSCPICDSRDIEKALMAPAVSAKGNNGGGAAGKEPKIPASNTAPDPQAMKAMMAEMAKAQAKALENSDYVGDNFADEARAMHDGEKNERPIHGETTLDEAKSLLDEGVSVSPLPFPVRPDKSDN